MNIITMNVPLRNNEENDVNEYATGDNESPMWSSDPPAAVVSNFVTRYNLKIHAQSKTFNTGPSKESLKSLKKL